MKKMATLGMATLFFLSGCQAQNKNADNAELLGEKSYKLLQCDKVINKKYDDKDVVKICYNYKVKGATYVEYEVEGDKVDEKIDKRPRFYAEKSIPKQYRIYPNDYIYITSLKHPEWSYDRGHLAPDADFDYNYKVLLKVYTMANIAPQVSELNRKTWIKSEKYERLVAKKLGRAKVSIGVLYNDLGNIATKRPLEYIEGSDKWSDSKIKKYYKYKDKLEKKQMVIPSGFWKKIENKEANFERCFYYDNVKPNIKEDRLKKHIIDCSELEGAINL
jgi:endonuclease G